MKRVTWSVTLHVRGPVLTKSSSIGELGIDAVMARSKYRDAVTGALVDRYYVPAGLIKGLLREEWQRFGVLNPRYWQLEKEWLGQPSPEGSDDHPERGRLPFGDFADTAKDASAGHDSEEAKRHSKRYRIQIDETRGAAAGQMLQVIDSPYAPGEEIAFTGAIRALVGDGEPLVEASEAIERAFASIRAVGANRSIGFGELLSSEVARTELSAVAVPAPDADLWNLRVLFDRPVILSKRQISANLFESGDVIPGGALTGALASMISLDEPRYAALKDELSRVRFTHAFPVPHGGGRPRELPLSLLWFGDAETGYAKDVLGETAAIVREDRAGAFDIDWKDEVSCELRRKAGWPRIPQELRVRTAIDSEAGIARDQQLFAWQMLVPHDIEWMASCDVSRLSQGARDQLAELLTFGVEPLGKTKALATVVMGGTRAPALSQCDTYAVTLQTPALLIDPGRQLAPNGRIGSSDRNDLRVEYKQVWSELSGDSLELVNYFARCTLAGGNYFARRFSSQAKKYKPYLLTNAGSTFLLRPLPGQEPQAQRCLEAWLRTGLPLMPSVCKFYHLGDEPDLYWQRCPYLPQNGYGEIAVNEPLEWLES